MATRQNNVRLEGGRRTKAGVVLDMPNTVAAFQEQERPILSVITVVYNGFSALEATIESIIDIPSNRIEYVVVDGGSVDGTLEILRRHDAALAHWISEPDTGIYNAFNKGVALARGEWVLFLGAGDLFIAHDSIAKILSCLQLAPPPTQICYGRIRLMSAAGTFVEEENDPWEEMRGRWKGGRQVMPHHQGIFQRREFLLSHPFDESYRIVSDYKVFMQAIAESSPVYINEVLSEIFVAGLTYMPQNSLAVAREIRRLNRELGLGGTHLPHQIFFIAKCAVKQALAAALPPRVSTHLIDYYRQLTGRQKKWS